MLPTIILQASDITSFESGLDSSKLLPQEALQPDAAFADILELGLDTAQQSAVIDGIELPHAGKDLPQEQTELEIRSAVQPINVLVQLAVIPRFSTLLSPATPVTVTPTTIISDQAVGPALTPLTGLATDSASARDPQISSLNLGLAQPVVDIQRPADPALPNKPAEGPNLQQTRLPIVGSDRSVEQSLRDQTIAATSAAGDPDALDDIRPVGKRPVLDALLARQGRAAATAAPQATEGIRNELPTDLKVQTNVTPTPLAVQPQAATANPIEISVGQQTQINVLSTTTAPAQASTESTAPPAQLTQPINLPVKDTAWGDRIGERVVLMASNRLQSAEIRLTPAELGPLRVQVAVDDGAANVTFFAQHAITREALEQALPRLKELLAENGLTLNQTTVADHAEQDVHHGGQDNSDDAATAAAASAEADDEHTDAETLATARLNKPADGLVDTFA